MKKILLAICLCSGISDTLCMSTGIVPLHFSAVAHMDRDFLNRLQNCKEKSMEALREERYNVCFTLGEVIDLMKLAPSETTTIASAAFVERLLGFFTTYNGMIIDVLASAYEIRTGVNPWQYM
jgi:hypothetical protein